MKRMKSDNNLIPNSEALSGRSYPFVRLKEAREGIREGFCHGSHWLLISACR